MGKLFRTISDRIHINRYLADNGVMYPMDYIEYRRMLLTNPITYGHLYSGLLAICVKEFQEYLEDNGIPVREQHIFFSRDTQKNTIALQYLSGSMYSDSVYTTPPLLPDMASRIEAYRNTCNNIRNKTGGHTYDER